MIDRIYIERKIFLEDIVIYTDKKKQIFLIVVNLIFIGFSLFTLGLKADNSNTWVLLSNLGSIVVALGFTFNLIRRIKEFREKEIIFKLTKDGFFDATSPLAIEPVFISWDMISKMEIQYLNIQGFISVELKDNQTFLNNLPKSRRVFSEKYIKNGFGAINISTQVSKDILLVDLLKEMNKRYLKYLKEK